MWSGATDSTPSKAAAASSFRPSFSRTLPRESRGWGDFGCSRAARSSARSASSERPEARRQSARTIRSSALRPSSFSRASRSARAASGWPAAAYATAR